MKRPLMPVLLGALFLQASSLDGYSIDCAVKLRSYKARNTDGYVRILDTVIHDANSFVEGLLIEGGFVYESQGLNGRSRVKKWRLSDGEIIYEPNMPRGEAGRSLFGEGLALFDDRLFQLTYKAQTVYVYNFTVFKNTGVLTVIDTYTYTGEGWGLARLGNFLIMSNGGSDIVFRNPHTFQVERSITVKDLNGPIRNINELEVANGWILANIWYDEVLLVIDPASGLVQHTIQAGPIMRSFGNVACTYDNTLNGIAWDDENHELWLTGKKWPTMFKVELLAADGSPLSEFIGSVVSVEATASPTSQPTIVPSRVPTNSTSESPLLTPLMQTLPAVVGSTVDPMSITQSTIDLDIGDETVTPAGISSTDGLLTTTDEPITADDLSQVSDTMHQWDSNDNGNNVKTTAPSEAATPIQTSTDGLTSTGEPQNIDSSADAIINTYPNAEFGEPSSTALATPTPTLKSTSEKSSTAVYTSTHYESTTTYHTSTTTSTIESKISDHAKPMGQQNNGLELNGENSNDEDEYFSSTTKAPGTATQLIFFVGLLMLVVVVVLIAFKRRSKYTLVTNTDGSFEDLLGGDQDSIYNDPVMVLNANELDGSEDEEDEFAWKSPRHTTARKLF